MLSCSCWDGDFDWYYEIPEDFISFDEFRRKRCISCNKLINFGADCVQFYCYRDAHTEIEEEIHGDTVELAYKYMCFDCGSIFLNLSELGYCLSIGHNVREDLEDYWDLTGVKPKLETKK